MLSASARYRCAACGNLTRFDVTATRRTRAFHHYSLSGDLSVEDPELLAEVVEDVSCRWCGSGRAVEPMPEAAPASDPVSGSGGAPVTDAAAPPDRTGG